MKSKKIRGLALLLAAISLLLTTLACRVEAPKSDPE